MIPLSYEAMQNRIEEFKSDIEVSNLEIGGYTFKLFVFPLYPKVQ